MEKKTAKNQSDDRCHYGLTEEEAIAAITDAGKNPKNLDPEKYGDSEGNFTGFDEDGNLWGYDDKGNYCVVSSK